ncbi:MAG: phosphatase PAP2 family protein [Acidimicrobiia bacterium]
MRLTAPFRTGTSATIRHPSRPVHELLVVVTVLVAYFGLRLLVEGERATAVGNAERLHELEARLGIDVERDVQTTVLDHPPLDSILSWGYVWLHWPLLVAAMALLTFRAPAAQARLRNAMTLSGALGVVCFATLPVAPPRFMPGFVGTVSDAARRHYLPYSLDWTNQFAAFPSYHVGWTLIACLAVAGALSSRWRWLAVAPAVVVAVAVIGTGNHYVIDTSAGAAFALGAWWLVGRRVVVPGAPDCGDDRTNGSAAGHRRRARRDLRRGARSARARGDRRLGDADVGVR